MATTDKDTKVYEAYTTYYGGLDGEGHDADHHDHAGEPRASDRPDGDEPSGLIIENYQRLGIETFNDKPIYDLDQIYGQISGEALPGGGAINDDPRGVITYSFNVGPVLTGLYNQGGGSKDSFRGDGLRPFNAEQQQAAYEAVQMWDDLVAATFVESNGKGADIMFANNVGPWQAYAFRPTQDQGFKYQGDIFVSDPDYNLSNAWMLPGGYGNTTIIHEVGHSIGLSHPGDYNGTGDYADDAEYAQDSNQYSIMSYFDQSDTGALTLNWNLLVGARAGNFLDGPVNPLINYAQTPQLHDIYVAQQLYGADPDTRSGDSTYGFNVSDDVNLWVFDFNENPYPTISIYDAGGEDTLDLSGFTVSQFVDLHDGAFSSIGGAAPTLAEQNAAAFEFYLDTFSDVRGVGFFTGYASSQAQIDEAFAAYSNFIAGELAFDTFALGFLPEYSGLTSIEGLTGGQYQNVSIAYGTVIENAIGGSANDGLLGNEVGNMLDGRAGDDSLFGFEGDDILIGGLGADTMTGGTGADTFAFSDLEMGDLITDFDGGEGDMIDLSGLVDDAGTDLSFIADAAFSGAAGEVRYEGGVLSMDANGDMAADFSVTIANGADLDATMLVLAAG